MGLRRILRLVFDYLQCHQLFGFVVESLENLTEGPFADDCQDLIAICYLVVGVHLQITLIIVKSITEPDHLRPSLPQVVYGGLIPYFILLDGCKSPLILVYAEIPTYRTGQLLKFGIWTDHLPPGRILDAVDSPQMVVTINLTLLRRF